jgi:hypothetical protein
MRIASVLSENGHKTNGAPAKAIAAPASGAEAVFRVNFVRGQTTPRQLRAGLLLASAVWIGLNTVALIGLTGSGMQAIQERFSLGAATTSREAVREMAVLYSEGQQRVADLNAHLALRRQELPLGGKLAALTRTLPARVWVTELAAGRKDRTLRLRAAYLLDDDRPSELPAGPWIAALKADPAFAAGLTRLDLGASSRQTQGRAELFTFELLAEWSDAP